MLGEQIGICLSSKRVAGFQQNFRNYKMKHYDFIEIGTSDFDTLIESSDDNVVGLSIEPIKYYLDR